MRLSGRIVLQIVEWPDRNDNVLVDDDRGTEIVLTTVELARMHHGIRYFAGHDQELTTAITTHDPLRRNTP
jgi:hypothetical protein